MRGAGGTQVHARRPRRPSRTRTFRRPTARIPGSGHVRIVGTTCQGDRERAGHRVAVNHAVRPGLGRGMAPKVEPMFGQTKQVALPGNPHVGHGHGRYAHGQQAHARPATPSPWRLPSHVMRAHAVDGIRGAVEVD